MSPLLNAIMRPLDALVSLPLRSPGDLFYGDGGSTTPPVGSPAIVEPAHKPSIEASDEKKLLKRGQDDSAITDDVVYGVDQVFETHKKFLIESQSSITKEFMSLVESRLRKELGNFFKGQKEELPKKETSTKQVTKKAVPKKEATEPESAFDNVEVDEVVEAKNHCGTFELIQKHAKGDKEAKEEKFNINYFCHDNRLLTDDRRKVLYKGKSWVAGYVPVKATDLAGGFKRLTVAMQMVYDHTQTDKEKQVWGRRVAQLNLKNKKDAFTLETFKQSIVKYELLQDIPPLFPDEPPPIPQILDANAQEGVIYLKYCTQGDLNDFVWNNQLELLEHSPKIVLQILHFFSKVHQKGYVFGDTKGENFLLHNFNINVCDFDTTRLAHTCGIGNEYMCQQEKDAAKKTVLDPSNTSISRRQQLAELAKENAKNKSQELPKKGEEPKSKDPSKKDAGDSKAADRMIALDQPIERTDDQKRKLSALAEVYTHNRRMSELPSKKQGCPGETGKGGTVAYYSHNRLIDYLRLSNEQIIFSSQIDDLVAMGYLFYYMLNKIDSPYVSFALYALKFHEFMKKINPDNHAYAVSNEKLASFKGRLESQKEERKKLIEKLIAKGNEIDSFNCSKFIQGKRSELIKLRFVKLIEGIKDAIDKGFVIDIELYQAINKVRVSLLDKLHDLFNITTATYQERVSKAKNIEKLGLVDLLYNLFYETQLAQGDLSITAASLLEKYKKPLMQFLNPEDALKEFEKAKGSREKGLEDFVEPRDGEKTLTRIDCEPAIEEKAPTPLPKVDEEEEDDDDEGLVKQKKGDVTLNIADEDLD